MKKYLLISLLTVTSFVIMAQKTAKTKMLTLEQTSVEVFKQKLIDSEQKAKIDSLIVLFNKERATLSKDKKTYTAQDLQAKSKKISGNFNNELVKALGSKDNYKKWKEIRIQKK
ncbi:MAG: hypothetical protein PHS30_00110 [Bacteroidales bacterium]|nr:hypothetical protein [Bacteroidales bacterium]